MRVLICSIGTSAYANASYLDSGGAVVHEGRFSGTALARMLGLASGDAVVVAHATQESLPNAIEAQRDLSGLGVRVEVRRLAGSWAEQVQALHAALAEVTDGGRFELHFDVTHGFRADPFLLLAVGKLLATRGVTQINGVHYARKEAAETSAFRLESLDDLLAVEQLADAAATMRETGVCGPLIAALERCVRGMGPGKVPASLRGLVKSFRELGEALAAGAVRLVQDALVTLRAQLKVGRDDPLKLRIVLEPLQAATSELVAACTDLAVSSSGPCLRLHSNLVAWYVGRSSALTAILVLGETLVTRMVTETGDPSRWLDKDLRQRARAPFDVLLHLRSWQGEELAPKTLKFLNEVRLIRDMRNVYAHCFMQRQDLKDYNDKVRNQVTAFLPYMDDPAIWRDLAAWASRQPAERLRRNGEPGPDLLA